MSEKELHSGGCSCGAVRYETHGNPTRVAVCHCRYCQTRTGSAFGMNVYFEDSQIQITSGELKDYSFLNNAKRQFHNRFCPNCGTTVFWSIEMRPGWTGIAAGTFDSPSFWFETDEAVQIFTRPKAPFVDVAFSDSHETAAYYAPIQSDRPGLSIQDEQPLKSYDLNHVTEKPAD